jgi:hypothetical protein
LWKLQGQTIQMIIMITEVIWIFVIIFVLLPLMLAMLSLQ